MSPVSRWLHLLMELIFSLFTLSPTSVGSSGSDGADPRLSWLKFSFCANNWHCTKNVRSNLDGPLMQLD